jgi:hypothetical protein
MTLAMARAAIVAAHLHWQRSLLFCGKDEALQVPAGMTRSSIQEMMMIIRAKDTSLKHL